TNAFIGCKNLKNVVLSENSTFIGASAFKGCKSLETIEFPDSLRRICENAFSGCKSLKTVTVPKEIYYIADSAFATGNPDFVICGSNRVAKKYAKKNNINYQKVKRKRS
ncbi:MAG: leucine-rich repeat domain-containing protein, partial [Ruminococcus sp.]|nr:leucine-rich repeat domain-containing protein [Ruminococcus sp.]